MDWLEKIPKWIQIPLKILLPALCIFSGFLLLIDDNLAAKLYLKVFRQQNGFAFGLIFLITLSLIFVYIIFFASQPVISKLRGFIIKREQIKKFKKIENAYKGILYQMYTYPTHTMKLDITSGAVNYLIGIRAINHSKASRGLKFDFFLQPWVIWGIESEIRSAEKIIRKYEENKDRLQKKKNYDEYKKVYETAKEFLRFVNTEGNIEEDSEW